MSWVAFSTSFFHFHSNVLDLPWKLPMKKFILNIYIAAHIKDSRSECLLLDLNVNEYSKAEFIFRPFLFNGSIAVAAIQKCWCFTALHCVAFLSKEMVINGSGYICVDYQNFHTWLFIQISSSHAMYFFFWNMFGSFTLPSTLWFMSWCVFISSDFFSTPCAFVFFFNASEWDESPVQLGFLSF